MTQHPLTLRLIVLLIIVATSLSAVPVHAQDDIQQAIVADGITAPVLAHADIPALPGEGTTLILERIELPAGSDMAPRTSPGPDILAVETGTLTITDDFGFTSTLPEGETLALKAGAVFSLSNPGPDPVTFLRLGLDAPAASDAPIDLTSDAAVDTLVTVPVRDVPANGATLFLAEATFLPGTSTGEQQHAGPVAILVTGGTLTMTSPSGIEGDIGAGQAVPLSETTPLRATSASGANVLIVGLVDDSAGFFTSLQPSAPATPEPTPEPTPTPPPALTPAPMPTALPTPMPTQMPTPAPVPTQLPYPTIAPIN